MNYLENDPLFNISKSYAAGFGNASGGVVFLANTLKGLVENGVLEECYGEFAEGALKDLERAREVIYNARIEYRKEV